MNFNEKRKKMPLYLYQCVHCQVREDRLGGLDDHLATCVHCGHMMLRLDFDLFSPYFSLGPEATAGIKDAALFLHQDNLVID
ncbi:MAG: hypothetical protein FJ135_07020 [Deltaproteobacteria bacterium]|nr:hypothetical protein [Deltaproteobacteria bacterium]